MKHTFTPGPWKISYRLPSASSPCRILGDGEVARIIYRGKASEDDWEANARLIAAAPELLGALLAVDRGFKDGSIKWAKPRQADSEPYHPANTLMCAAIAKATGD